MLGNKTVSCCFTTRQGVPARPAILEEGARHGAQLSIRGMSFWARLFTYTQAFFHLSTLVLA